MPLKRRRSILNLKIMREFFNTNGLFDILGWTKRKEYIKKPANDE